MGFSAPAVLLFGTRVPASLQNLMFYDSIHSRQNRLRRGLTANGRENKLTQVIKPKKNKHRWELGVLGLDLPLKACTAQRHRLSLWGETGSALTTNATLVLIVLFMLQLLRWLSRQEKPEASTHTDTQKAKRSTFIKRTVLICMNKWRRSWENIQWCLHAGAPVNQSLGMRKVHFLTNTWKYILDFAALNHIFILDLSVDFDNGPTPTDCK